VEAGRAAGARVVGLTTTLAELPGTELQIADFRDPRLEPWLHSAQPRGAAHVHKE
jgi:hypothetical protein